MSPGEQIVNEHASLLDADSQEALISRINVACVDHHRMGVESVLKYLPPLRRSQTNLRRAQILGTICVTLMSLQLAYLLTDKNFMQAGIEVLGGTTALIIGRIWKT